MSKAGALDLASGVGGKIEKNAVLSAVEQYEKYQGHDGGEEEERKANYTDMVREDEVEQSSNILHRSSISACVSFLFSYISMYFFLVWKPLSQGQ